MKTPLLAFHNNPKIKAKYLRRIRAHRKADEIINGQYWEDGMGCAVGCTIHGSDHLAYESELGIPVVLARLEDRLFESLYRFDPARAKEWPEIFLSSIKEGADLAMVWPRFAHWLLVDPTAGMIRFATKERTKKAIEKIANLYALWIGGSKPGKTEWTYAADAADAADADAYAAAADAAVDAAAYAAYAAADAAAAAAYAAAAAAAYAAAAAAADAYAARNKYVSLMADKLIELLKAA